VASRKQGTWILIICVAALLVLIFFEPSYGWSVRTWLAPKNVSVANDTAGSLAVQNQTLQAQLAELENIASQLPQNPQNEIRAMVYSQYPFGFKNELLLNAGSDGGVAVGKAVTFHGIFIGSVAQVFSDSAVVQTVFDPSLKMPVRIGTGGTDALLIGGSYPQATSIAKSTSIAAGDIVYTAAPGFPYGLPIGIVNATTTSADNLFQQAALGFAYDVGDLQTVLIDR
jgi:cell shape-determining protein MreC